MTYVNKEIDRQINEAAQEQAYNNALNNSIAEFSADASSAMTMGVEGATMDKSSGIGYNGVAANSGGDSRTLLDDVAYGGSNRPSIHDVYNPADYLKDYFIVSAVSYPIVGALTKSWKLSGWAVIVPLIVGGELDMMRNINKYYDTYYTPEERQEIQRLVNDAYYKTEEGKYENPVYINNLNSTPKGYDPRLRD
jgi:hypothetical protein